ncbi:MAG: hypothetical protein KKF65_00500 [Nanoarchaeota archaeon]|nr:hypothetical protein [Nanoarchaeota archaeon]
MKWEFVARRENDFFKNCLLYEALVKDFVKVWNFPYYDILTLRDGLIFIHYMNFGNDIFSKFVFKKTLKDKSFVKRVVNDGKKYFEKLILFCMSLGNFKSRSNNELLFLIRYYMKLYKRIYPNFLITVAYSEFEKAKNQEIIDELAKFRLYSRDTFEKIHSLSYCLFEEIGKRFGLTVHQIKFLTPMEIESLLKLKKIDVEMKLKERQSCFFIHLKGKFIFCQNATVYLNYEKNPNVNNVKGMVVFKGNYKGKARLIEKVEDMNYLKKGEILIISMTMPNYITSKFKNAGAIVTDEGGITCHAAIVARELGKPCVIGTGIASEVFKDGDMVEVDADNGVVRKLS